MQRYRLTVDKFLDHAAKWHGTACVASKSAAGETERLTYPQLRDRSRGVSGAMLNRGRLRAALAQAEPDGGP